MVCWSLTDAAPCLPLNCSTYAPSWLVSVTMPLYVVPFGLSGTAAVEPSGSPRATVSSGNDFGCWSTSSTRKERSIGLPCGWVAPGLRRSTEYFVFGYGMLITLTLPLPFNFTVHL